MKRIATAIWKGPGSEGSGVLNTTSGVLENVPYSGEMRFGNEDGKAGTNPEELIAAAHAGCYAMALSFSLNKEGFTSDKLDVTATVSLDKVENGFEISHIHLDLKGEVEGISKEKFESMAKDAKSGCPVSKALKAVDISLDIQLQY
ncbi:MAG: OsmC family protein [Saprospiraceae bacterium]|nr:OsmC family protein [Saprospiraceae bacterium]